MVDRVIELDDLPVHADGIGDVHQLRLDQVAHGAGHAGFTVARRAVHEDGGTRVNRRAQARIGFFREHQVRQHLPHEAVGDLETAAALAADGFVIDGNRHGGRASVLAAVERLASAGDAGAGNGIDIGTFPQAHLRGADFQQFFALQGFEKLVHNTGKRQGNIFGDAEAGHVALEVHNFQDQVLQPERRQARIFHSGDGRRNKGHGASADGRIASRGLCGAGGHGSHKTSSF